MKIVNTELNLSARRDWVMHVVQRVPLLLHPLQEVDYHSLPLSFHSFLSEDLRDVFKRQLIMKHLLLSVKRNMESASEVRQY